MDHRAGGHSAPDICVGSACPLLYLESYGSGSHERIARLLQRFSRHHVDIIFLARDHWRWLALAGHRTFARAISSLNYARPDFIVYSGPASATLVISALPRNWSWVASAAYFHESQWTYPAIDFDPRPYLVGHLETLEAVDQVWFNSSFHHHEFRRSALANPSSRVRRLAHEIVERQWCKTRVLHPPVHVETQPANESGSVCHIAWAARWERDKRPDILVRALQSVISAGLEPLVHLLGSPSGVPSSRDEIPEMLRPFIAPGSGFPGRMEYERRLSCSDIWISTAEHEFFGVAALEAALLGATPIVPRALAYPETLPSAPSYAPGDHEALAGTIMAIAGNPSSTIRPWRYDAGRYIASRTVLRFDELVAEAVGSA